MAKINTPKQPTILGTLSRGGKMSRLVALVEILKRKKNATGKIIPGMTAINSDIPSSFFRDNIWISSSPCMVFSQRETSYGCSVVLAHVCAAALIFYGANCTRRGGGLARGRWKRPYCFQSPLLNLKQKPVGNHIQRASFFTWCLMFAMTCASRNVRPRRRLQPISLSLRAHPFPARRTL